jgi:ABC-type Mn2+/Zn2+ transport system ATPase subunit
LLLLDEPYAGLDREAAEGLSGILEGLRTQGIAVLMSSHDLDMVAASGGRVLVLGNGVAFDGDAKEWSSKNARISGT